MGKTVLCLCPTFWGYEKRTRDAVEANGHDAVWMDERIGNSFFAKASIRFGLIRFMPWVLKRHVDAVIAKLKEIGADTLLHINPETINGVELKRIKAALPHLEIIVYTWDGFGTKPITPEAFEVADAVYSFDLDDCARVPGLGLVPLWHNHETPPTYEDTGPKAYDFSFVGKARFRRIKVLAALEKLLHEQDRPHFFYLVTDSALQFAIFRFAKWRYGYRGTLTRTSLAYEQFLEVVRESRCAVDIEVATQSGLTIRTLEVVFAGTPLLTTNETVARYDFYPDSTVFVFDENAPELPPTEALVPKDNSTFFAKYSVRGWAETVVNRTPGDYLLDPVENVAVSDGVAQP